MRTSTAVLALFAVLAPVAAADPPPPKAKAPPSLLQHLTDEFQALSERITPSVVQVVAAGYAPAAAAEGGLLTRERNAGSGAIVDADGYVVTNAHVVEGAQSVYVLLRTRERAPAGSILGPRSRRLTARVAGVDEETDLAVLKVDEGGLPALAFADSEELRQGQVVLAFGSPLGLENSVSMGVVSSVARQLTPEDPMIYIQTDAPINPGNSGGPLVDIRGRLVGINTLIASHGGGSEGIGFAAPSNIVRTVFEQIKARGRVYRGAIGARPQTVSPALAAGLGLGQDWGVVLADVTPEGPGDRAGLRIGDMVLKLDGKVMENARQFDVNLYRRAVGDAVTLEVLRGAQKLTVEVAVMERPEDPDRFQFMVTPEKNLVPRLGILAIELDDAVRRLLPALRGEDGVVVAARAPGVAPEGGPLPGDVIYALNGITIRGLGELRVAAERMKSGDAVVLQVERKGQLRFLAFRVE
jgi:serine protease Do